MTLKLKNEIIHLKKQEKELLKALSVSIANRERLDDDLADDRKEQGRLKTRKAHGQVYDKEKLREVNESIRVNREKVLVVRKRLAERRSNLKKVRIRIGKATRRLRNLAKPRIIDLDLAFRPMTVQGTVDKVIGHYTAGPQDENTKDAIRLCRLYHQAHLNQGWSGEAYMICFTVDGDILVLRPARYVGAHTLGYNTGSYGVMCHGTTGDRPTGAQKRAMRWWAKNGHKRIMGKAQTQKRPDSYRWYGHNDFNATGCPGSFKPSFLAKGQK